MEVLLLLDKILKGMINYVGVLLCYKKCYTRWTKTYKFCLHCTRVFIIFFANLPGLWTVKKGIQGSLNAHEKIG